MKTNFSCGLRIRELRTERKLSQEQLALAAGITPAYLGLVERGQRNATVMTIERIAFALDISLADFFDVAGHRATSDNKTDQSILYQLRGLDDEEKELCAQILKNIVQLRMHSKKKRKEEKI